ncbi:MAG: hypothetical protein AB9917_11025 [Negativicutes bacterium]
MESKDTKEKKTLQEYIRMLHRNIGFFVIGLTMIYSLSGIVLVYRTTDFLKQDTWVQKTISKDITSAELSKTLRVREINIVKSEGNIVYFRAGDNIKNGKYDKATGMVSYTEKKLPALLNKFNELHKASSRNSAHLFSVVYGILLFFLAVSSFWMYKPGTKMFRQGIYIALAGFLAALLMLWL